MKIKTSVISNIILYRTIYFLSFLIFTTSCLSLKPTSVKSGKNLFETFYIGEDGTQYFIKPLTFINKQNKEDLQIDFTFRHKDKIKDSVIVNFSIIGSNIIKNTDSISFYSKTDAIKTNNVKLLFNEKRNKSFVSRFTTKILFIDFINMFKNDTWEIVLYDNENNSFYLPERKTKKRIKKLQEKLFIIF